MVVCGNELVGPVGRQKVVVVPEVVGTQVGIVVDDVGDVGNVPPGMVVDVVEGSMVAVVVGMQGTVVVDGSLGMQGGRVVDVVGTVGPVVPVAPVVDVMPCSMVVVVVDGAVEVLVVVPGGAPEHPSSCNSDGNSSPKPGKAPNRASRDRTSWQMGSRMDGSSWARVIRPVPSTVWAPLLSGCPTTIPIQTASTQSPMRRRLPEARTVILPPR